jgi:hypothetical protein
MRTPIATIIATLLHRPAGTRATAARTLARSSTSLFGEENPLAGHGLPELDPQELDEFVQRRRRFVR